MCGLGTGALPDWTFILAAEGSGLMSLLLFRSEMHGDPWPQ
jgi:hypothetical protein